MITKVLEIRDRATYIPVIAIEMVSVVPEERRHLRRLGFDQDGNCTQIMLVKMEGDSCNYDPYNWPNSSRTMHEAHVYISEHFNELNNGDVVDVEFVLGETKIKKQSDCLY